MRTHRVRGNYVLMLASLIILMSCQHLNDNPSQNPTKNKSSGVGLIVLGTVQDAGSPQIGCKKSCCRELFKTPDSTRKVVSLGLVDFDKKQSFLFEATPDVTSQVHQLIRYAGTEAVLPDAVFLTHAHIGHYTGLMYFGHEAIGADSLPVFVMPRFLNFLKTNGPWSQLVSFGNIQLHQLQADSTLNPTPSISIKPVLVPHRDEYSETVGFIIEGPYRKALFIPDIDKWHKWEKSVISLIEQMDLAFVDATFFDAAEINHRDISQIPHPFVIESMKLFQGLSASDRKKVHFIHFNHTNPLLNQNSKQYQQVLDSGFQVASINQTFDL